MLAGTAQPGGGSASPLSPAPPGPPHARSGAGARAAELIRLSRLANDYAGTLSGGQRKLPSSVAPDDRARMILLDESMAGGAAAIQLLNHHRAVATGTTR
jgi:ABC-type branched-subunit amino acid transport system ATPase component